ncbi:MAG: nucleotidyltransferase domain-containing protein [Vannielia sp.]|uniref:nucleotidyltransferase domain-containing protein n=1 Tax=Vannielia sp. TaxID=2813045 RepID=UPI003B8E62E8
MTWLSHPDAALVRGATEVLSSTEELDALFLAGSHGRGSADDFSDIDLLAVAQPGGEAAVAAALETWLKATAGLAYWQAHFGGRLINAITSNWRRIDLSFVAQDALKARPKNTLVPLHDPEGLHGLLAPPRGPVAPSPQKVTALALEFLRVLGLLHVGAGRGEWVLLVKGLGLLRDMLVDLMLEEVAEPEKGGILHLSRLLPEADMALLLNLPYPGPERAALLKAYAEVAGAFLPRAKALHARLELPWPTDFEAATRDVLRRELALELS